MATSISRVDDSGLKFAVYDDDVLIAEVVFAPKGLDYEVHPAHGRPLTKDEQQSVSSCVWYRNWGRIRSVKGWKTRRERQQLRAIYALEDTRGSLCLPEAPLDSLERLSTLDDPRG